MSSSSSNTSSLSSNTNKRKAEEDLFYRLEHGPNLPNRVANGIGSVSRRSMFESDTKIRKISKENIEIDNKNSNKHENNFNNNNNNSNNSNSNKNSAIVVHDLSKSNIDTSRGNKQPSSMNEIESDNNVKVNMNNMTEAEQIAYVLNLSLKQQQKDKDEMKHLSDEERIQLAIKNSMNENKTKSNKKNGLIPLIDSNNDDGVDSNNNNNFPMKNSMNDNKTKSNKNNVIALVDNDGNNSTNNLNIVANEQKSQLVLPPSNVNNNLSNNNKNNNEIEDEQIQRIKKQSLLDNITTKMNDLKVELLGVQPGHPDHSRRLKRLNTVCDQYPNDMSKALNDHGLTADQRFIIIQSLMQCLYLNNGGRETFENDKALDNDGSNNDGGFKKAQMGTLWEDMVFQLFKHFKIGKADAANKLFCDIGSGFGQIVLQGAVEYNIYSVGLELVKNRHETAVYLQRHLEQLFKYMYLYKYKKRHEEVSTNPRSSRGSSSNSSSSNSSSSSSSGSSRTVVQNSDIIVPRCIINRGDVTDLKINDSFTMFLNGSFGDENDNYKKPNITPGDVRINDILTDSKWNKIGTHLFPRFCSNVEAHQESKCKLNVIELFQKIDYFFLNNAKETMEGRNTKEEKKRKEVKLPGSKLTLIEHIMELGYYMKIGAVLISVDRINFRLNDWSSSKFHKNDDYPGWMKEEEIEMNGRLSWNKSSRYHKFYKYTKLRNNWKCNYCTYESPFISSDGSLLLECLVKTFGGGYTDDNGVCREFRHPPSETRKKTRNSGSRK